MARRHILHIKSGKALDDKMYGVISQPKIPSPDQIEPGEIAVNYADGVETISTLSVGVNQENEIERKVVTFSSDRALYDVEEAVATAIVGLDNKIENNAQDVSGQISVVYDTIKNKEKVTSAALNDLNNRKANKSDTYTKTEVDNLLNNVEIDIDDALDTESENPVQNKVVSENLSRIELVSSAAFNDLNSKKADKSDTYTKTEVDNMLNNFGIEVDDALDAESENPVQNKVVSENLSRIELVSSAAFNDLNDRKLDRSEADGFLTVESDPVFTSSAAYSISEEDINRWNGAGSSDLIVSALVGWVCDTDFQTIVDAHKDGRQVYFRYPGASRDNHAGQTVNSPALIPLKKVTEDDGDVEGEVEFSASWFEPKFDTFVQYTIFVVAEGNVVSQSFTAADPLLKADYNPTNPILSLDKASCPFDLSLNRDYSIRVLIPDEAINTSRIRIHDFATFDIKEFVHTLSKTGGRISLKEINMSGGETLELEFDPDTGQFIRKNYMRIDGAAASDESVSGVSYNSQSQKIVFTDKSGSTIAEIDATAFIKDGMVNSASVVDGDIVITFNTDAGKDAIHIPLNSIVTVDAELTENGTNPVQGGAIYAELKRNELVVSSALNDLNDRKLDSASIAEWAKSDVKPTYTYDEVGAMPNTTKYAASIGYDSATRTFSLYDQNNVSMDSTTLPAATSTTMGMVIAGNDINVNDGVISLDKETVVDDTTMTSTKPATTKAIYEAIEEAARVASAGINQNKDSITSLNTEVTRLSSLIESYHDELATLIEMEGDTLYINQ